MTIFTIDNENNITAFATAEAAAAASTTPFDLFTDQMELAELLAGWPAQRWVATYNNLPGVKPVKALKDSKTAASKIWERVAKLGQMVTLEPAAAKSEAAPAKMKGGKNGKPQAERQAKRGARVAQGAPVKGQAAPKATAVKNAPRAKLAAPAPEVGVAERGSKKAEVIAMLRRKNGATLSEIMRTMRWQKHTVRGFMAGAMKKAGHTVESFKPAGGERTYRLK